MTDARWIRYADETPAASGDERAVVFRDMSAVTRVVIYRVGASTPTVAPGHYVVFNEDDLAGGLGPFADYTSAEEFVTSIVAPYFPELPA